MCMIHLQKVKLPLRNCSDAFVVARVPSWTDRILFKSVPTINLLEYNSATEMRHSDHRPVFAKFEVEYDVKEEQPDATATEMNSKVCIII